MEIGPSLNSTVLVYGFSYYRVNVPWIVLIGKQSLLDMHKWRSYSPKIENDA